MSDCHPSPRLRSLRLLAELRHGSRNTGIDTLKRLIRRVYARRFLAMRLYALVEAGDPEAIDVYLCEQDAQRSLEDCLRDEPQWRGLMTISPSPPTRAERLKRQSLSLP